MLLLDAGVWASVDRPQERFHRQSRALVLDRALPLAALDLTLYEVANVATAKIGQPERARHWVSLVLARCEAEPVRIGAELIGAAIELAAEHGLTVYDAAYVAAARRNGWTLVSTDIEDLVSKGLAVAPDAAVRDAAV